MFSKYPHDVRVVKLDDRNTVLTEFYFRRCANVYVFSYESQGQRKHAFIDSGYLEHRNLILPILRQYHIDPEQIEHIIITHRHMDHCGLALYLAQISGADIVVHEAFRGFVEGDLEPREKIWLGKLNPGRFRNCRMDYRTPADSDALDIEGIRFPRMGNRIPIGASGELEILACPDHHLTHSPDQLLIRYSQHSTASRSNAGVNDKLSDTDMIFSGDLWLMTGPVVDKSLSMLPLVLRYAFIHLKERLAGRRIVWDDPRDQDPFAKEALKKGFSLIEVKPGHGEAFLGCRIVPNGLLADRDLLVKLGYLISEDPEVLSSVENKGRIAELTEVAYRAFVAELQFWLEMGDTIEKVAERLQRIYKEQTGGGKLVANDRKQRRERMKETLLRLAADSAAPQQLCQIAALTPLP